MSVFRRPQGDQALRRRREARRRRLLERERAFAAPCPRPASLWNDLFGNDAPVELEIGSGTGTFIFTAAAANPGINFVGIERSFSRARRLFELAERHRRSNVRILQADAVCVLRTVVPPASVSAYHIYFPDPWWKRRHFGRRLFTPSFAALLADTLVPGGRVHTATDVEEVFDLIRNTLRESGLFRPSTHAPPPRSGPTSFERKGLLRGATIHQATFIHAAR